MMAVPEELQAKVVQFEQLRQQIQIIATQRLQMEAEAKEVSETVEVLGGLSEGTAVYRKAGTIMVKVDDIEALKKDLEDRMETLELRVKSLRNQEETMKDSLEKLQKEINEELSRFQSRTGINLGGGPQVG